MLSRWKAPIQCERKDRTGNHVDVLNLTRNSSLGSSNKEKISTDGFTTGYPVFFAWNNCEAVSMEKTGMAQIYKALDE